jgi:hypothetical protein
MTGHGIYWPLVAGLVRPTAPATVTTPISTAMPTKGAK